MTKKELAKAIAEELNMPQETAKKAVQRVFDGIIDALVKEGRIELRDFGVFEVRRRKPRKARNPGRVRRCRCRNGSPSDSSPARRWRSRSARR